MDGMRRLQTIWIAVAICLPGSVHADIPWKSKEYFHTAEREPLVKLLRGFAADQAIPIILSDAFAGEGDAGKLVVSGRFGPMPPIEFLNRITSSNGLIWYFDGSSIYIYRSNELQTQLIMLDGVDDADFRESLRELSVLTDRFPLKSMSKYGAVYIAGPPRYLELVQKTLDLLKSTQDAEAAAELDIAVIKLQYAWADDTTFFFRNTEVTVPGVASVLTNLMSGKAAPTTIQGANVRQRTRNLPGLKGQGLLAIGRQPETELYSDPISILPQPLVGSAHDVAADPSSPVILADRRLNSVIIRDLKERLPAYKKLIETLDIPTGLVEIEATIVDVDTNSGFEWGPPVEARWRNGVTEHQANLNLNTTDVSTFAFTLLRGGQTEFLAKLKALETDGSARVVSRPSVLTVDNIEAHLDNTQTFYVRVAGDFEVDLFDVTVGTSLRITPHIIDGPRGGRKVKLIVHVEDGRATDDNVDGIPRIAQSTVDTQAVLNENESLLIGGLMREEATHAESRIPFLGRIPKVGYLFKTVTTDNRQLERLVMITPRLIELPVHDFCEDDGRVFLDEEFVPTQPLIDDMFSPIHNENQIVPIPFDGPVLPDPGHTWEAPPAPVPAVEGSGEQANAKRQLPSSRPPLSSEPTGRTDRANPFRTASLKSEIPTDSGETDSGEVVRRKNVLSRAATAVKSWASRIGRNDEQQDTRKKSEFFRNFK